MAFSKSVVKAQDILLCQLCETDPKIKWKCVECQLLMCTNCRDRIHPKFKNADEHEVLNLKEVKPQGEGGGQKLDFTRIRCKQHQGQVCCFFCSSCDKLVCPTCTLKSHNGHQFIEIKEAYNMKMNYLEKSKGKLGVEDQTKMVKAIIDTTDMSQFFDEVDKICQMIDKVSLTNKSTDIQMTVVKEFSSDMKYIHRVSVCKDNSIWLGDGLSKVIQKVKLDGSSLKPISTFKSALRGMVITPSGDLLFTDSGSTLKQINGRSGEITNTKYSVSQLYITSVHMTYNNKIIVGAISNPGDKPLYPATGRRVVIVMNETGRQEVVYENDNNNKRLFTYPDDISSTRSGSIGVVDSLSSDCIGRVVVLLDGNITGIYKGHPDVNKDKRFRPAKVAATPTDNYIVSDLNTHNLHIMDRLGHVITYYNPGIQYPHSLSFSSSGQLYIGTSPPKGSSYNAKLYIVDISGC